MGDLSTVQKVHFIWYDKEEKFLKNLCKVCNELSETYMTLYRVSHKTQSRLRLPAIVLSSFSGVASFGTQSFPSELQKYVSIVVGLINVCIAMIQTYESYIKIADTVSRALTVSTGLKKLGDDIKCELSIPIENREANGITFLRDCFSRYQAIVYQAPPLEFDDETAASVSNKNDEILDKIKTHMKKKDKPAPIQREEYSDNDDGDNDDGDNDDSISKNSTKQNETIVHIEDSPLSPLKGFQPTSRLRGLMQQNAELSKTTY
jgi:hypothetical protein